MNTSHAPALHVCRFAFHAAVSAFSVGMRAQEAGSLPDQPATGERVGPAAIGAWRSPFEAVATKNAATAKAAVPESANLGAERNNIHLFNVHGGFEPIVFRPKVRPIAASRDTVELDPGHATAIAPGFYDGARVRLYQAIDGKLELIRHAKAPPGGRRASGWLESRAQVSAAKGTTTCQMKIDASFLPDRE